MKRETNPMAKSMGVASRSLPPIMVPIQLNVLMADGTAMAMVRTENAKAE